MLRDGQSLMKSVEILTKRDVTRHKVPSHSVLTRRTRHFIKDEGIRDSGNDQLHGDTERVISLLTIEIISIDYLYAANTVNRQK